MTISAYFKKLGRVSKILSSPSNFASNDNKKIVVILVDLETVTLYFGNDVDLNSQKDKLSNKINELHKKIHMISQKLSNKSFLKNAPKDIVKKEKNLLFNYNIEVKKLNSILNSIKN